MSPDFHLDPNKQTDPIEKLVAEKDLEDAFDELMDKLDKNPDDAETRRQANLLVNRVDDLKELASRLREKIGH